MPPQESTSLFDLSTLRDNTPLDTKQEAFVRATVSSTQDLISGLDAKIRDTENALAELHKQRDAALETMAIPVALLAPVRRLSSEILGEIFLQCVPELPLEHATPFDTRDAPLLLTHVCHRWRQVAQGTPLLWDRLIVYGRKPEAFFSSIWLKNSGSLPLDICVEKYGPNPQTQETAGDPSWHPVYTGHGWRMDRRMVWVWPKDVSDQNAQMVVENFARIRRLFLDCEANELRGYFPKEAVAIIPSLQELWVDLTSIWNVDPTAYLFHNFFMPRLHNLVLDNGAELLLPALECPNLQTLDIRGNCTVETFVDFVRMCPALDFIQAVNMDLNYPREPRDMSHIILPGVSILRLGISYESTIRFNGGFLLDRESWIYLTKSLERLRTPNLESLGLSYLHCCGHIISNCMAASHSGLHTLTIREIKLDANYLRDAMFIFSAIEELDIFECVISPGFWESLTHAEDTPSRLWTFPKLKTLVLEQVYMAPEDEAEFVRFVESRAPPILSQGQSPFEGICYLEGVELIQCTFSEETLIALEWLTEGREDFVISTEDSRRYQSQSEGDAVA